jgi:hypothetical protein
VVGERPARGRSVGSRAATTPSTVRNRRGGGRGGAGSASTDRGRAPPRESAGGSSKATCQRGAHPSRGRRRRQPRNTTFARRADGPGAACPLLVLALGHERGEVLVGGSQVPFGPVGCTPGGAPAARRRPLGQRRPRSRTPRRRGGPRSPGATPRAGRSPASAPAATRPGWGRGRGGVGPGQVAGQVDVPGRARRRGPMRAGRPQRAASARWRPNEPAP